MTRPHTRSVTICLVIAALAGAASAQTVYGVTSNQRLISFAASTPGTIQSGVAIQGLQANEDILGIDFRTANGQLYGLGSFSNLYSIDVATGIATRVNGTPFGPALNGSSFGFDFNPTIDRIRVVSEVDQNLVLNPDTGAATNTTPLFYAAGDPNQGINPNVVGSAYTNAFAGATVTQLYGIDTRLDVLVRQANSAGTLTTVGSLGVDLGDALGFDIDGRTNIGYASVIDTALSRSTFWTINLLNGSATQIGEIGGGAFVTAIAIVPTVPAPGAAAALAASGLLVSVRRRR